MTARFLIAMLLLGAVSESGGAQSTTPNARGDRTSALMTPGARVRVMLPGEHAWLGTLVSLAGDSMVVRGASGSDTTLVRLSQATEVDVSVGMRRSRHLVRNTMISTGIGAGLGWVIGSAMRRGGCQVGDPCFDSLVCVLGCYAADLSPNPPVRDHAAAGTVIGGLAGGTLALLVSRARSEDWRPVSVTRQRTSLTLSPGGGRVAIAF